MYGSSFVRLVEDEYMSVLRETTELKKRYGFKAREKPEYICTKVQRFRNWLTMVVRTVEVTVNGTPVNPLDILVHAASSVSFDSSHDPLHPKLRSALTLFQKDDFDAIFGSYRRNLFESRTTSNVSCCQFRLCHEHCQEVRKALLEGNAF